MESIEATGATVEEAVEAGMKELGVTSPSQVMVEVVQEPDAGIMGEGARPAIVRLLFMGTRPGAPQQTSIISNPNLASPQGTTQIVANPYVPEDDVDDEDIDVILTIEFVEDKVILGKDGFFYRKDLLDDIDLDCRTSVPDRPSHRLHRTDLRWPGRMARCNSRFPSGRTGWAPPNILPD